MWWPKTIQHTPHPASSAGCGIGRFFILALLCFVTACGFTPVYSKRQQHQQTPSQLLETSIDPIPGRAGQILHTALEDLLNPFSRSATPRYRLTVSVEERLIPLGIQRDKRITRYNVIEEAKYTLKTIDGKQVIDDGRVWRVGSYDAVDSDFATFVAKDDTVERTLREVGKDIHSRLIAAFLKLDKDTP